MSRVHSRPQPGSDSDSDFSKPDTHSSPEPLSNPRRTSNIQAQSQPKTASQSRPDISTKFRSSPPVVPSSSKALQRKLNDVHQSQVLDTLDPEPSSSQQNLQAHHLGPFASSPTQSLPPQIRQSRSQSKSHSPFSPQRRPVQKHPLRPNSYTGPPSTWREWTQNERTAALSLERTRAQDLSVHLYCAHVLRKKAELARSRERSLSQSRSRSRSQNRLKNKVEKGKGKAKEDRVNSPAVEPREEEENPLQDELVFLPPRLWTAWPLPPLEVPREEFLPSGLLGVSNDQKTTRSAAELEDCLIAVTSRHAKERWEAREWEPENDKDNSKLRRQDVKRQKPSDSNTTKGGFKHESHRTDTEMEDSEGAPSDQDQESENDSQSDSGSQRALQPPAPDNDFPMFSSQLFTAPSSPSSQTSHSSQPGPTIPKPVFSADDDRLRQLLLPSTRHVTSQLDVLLLALHKIQRHKGRKSVNIGGRGYQEIVSIAGVMFSDEVVGRARERCERLLNGFQ